jgi:hypothetical protein
MCHLPGLLVLDVNVVELATLETSEDEGIVLSVATVERRERPFAPTHAASRRLIPTCLVSDRNLPSREGTAA